MAKILRKISIDTFLFSIIPQLPKLMNFFLLPLTSPYLGALDFAVFGTVMAFVMGFETLKTLGLEIILMNSFFKDPDGYRVTWRKVEGFISIWSLILTCLIGLTLFFVLPRELPETEKWLIILSTSLPSFLFAGVNQIAILFYQYSQRPLPIVLRSFIIGLIAVFLNYYFIAILKIGYMGWFYSGLITGIAIPLSYLYPIWIKEKLTPMYNLKYVEVVSMLKVSLPILPHHYASYFLNYSDRVLLSLFGVSNYQVGIYNLGYSVSGNFRFFSNSVDRVIGPLFHKSLSSNGNDEVIRPTVFSLAIFYILIGFLGGIWMKELFSILIRNTELRPAYSIAIIILFSFATRPLYNGAQSLLFFEEKTKSVWYVTFMFGVLNVLLNIIFIPIFGIPAAAVNTFICIAGSNYGIFLLKDYKQVSRFEFYPIRWLFITIIVFSVSWYFKDAFLLVKFMVTLTAVVAAVFSIFLLRKRVTR